MANRFLVAGGDGNWNNTNNWAATTGAASGASFPVAGDVVALDSNSGNAPLTINVASACASFVLSGTYAGTLTFTSTLTLTSTCTFVSACTIAGTAGTLLLGGTATITSAGKTLTCGLTFTANVVYTLADNWTVNGLVAVNSAGSPQFNGNQITCAGGFRLTAGNTFSSGTTKFRVTGGTLDSTGGGTFQSNVDLDGNVTVSGTITYGAGKTLRYLSGTITTTGSTLVIGNFAGMTLDTAGVTWNNVTFSASQSYATSSTLAVSGTLTISGNAVTFTGAGAISCTGSVVPSGTTSTTFNNTGGLTTTGTMTLINGSYSFLGSAGWTVGTLTNTTYTASRTVTLTFGNTYTVTTSFVNVGTTLAIRQSIVSSVPGSKVVLNLQSGGTADLVYCDPTDVNSSGGKEILTVRGTITTSTNWVTAATAASTGGARVLSSSIIQGAT